MSSPDAISPNKASWRSSPTLVIFTSTLGLFTENFLYGFIVPIIPYMFERRLHQDPAYSQRYASALLFIVGFIAVFVAPLIGHILDKTPNRKIPLVLALVCCIIGTILVSTTLTVWTVFLGRIIQGAGSQGTWIMCLAMITDNINKKHHGKTLGLTSSFTTGGVLMGPTVAGAALEYLGYWAAWAVPFVLLAMDLFGRLVLVEKRKVMKAGVATTDTNNEVDSDEADEADEATGLLASAGNANTTDEEAKLPSSRGFYRVMLTNGSVIASLINVTLFSIIVAAFDSTFPLHLRHIFDWGPARIGLIFLLIQVPGMLTGPFVGWLRDRVGLRKPTTLGWALIAPIVCLIGVPGSSVIPVLDASGKAEVAFVGLIIVLALVAPLVRGSGTFQMTVTLRELQDKDPEIFGPHGGSSRLFSLMGVAFNVGLMTGPVLGGVLAESFGFFVMMATLAVLCLISAVLSSIFLSDKSQM